MIRLGRLVVWSCAIGLVLIALGLGYLAWAKEPEIAPMAPIARERLPTPLVRQGAALARIGNCRTCHTVSSMVNYAGGAAVTTPVGSMYPPNISPDPETGLGRWSLAAFTRALKQGVSRDGHHLYPALPYEHLSGVTDHDVAALYAYLMTRPPVHSVAPANRLPPPLTIRAGIAAWKLAFFRPAFFSQPPRSDPVWNRGAYLAEGLAHCGSCHTPRNLAFAEKHAHPLAGGWADGWNTPPLNGEGEHAPHWSVAQVETYLRHGVAPDGSRVKGPMMEVVSNLAGSPPQDVHAIAVYIADRMTGAR